MSFVLLKRADKLRFQRTSRQAPDTLKPVTMLDKQDFGGAYALVKNYGDGADSPFGGKKHFHKSGKPRRKRLQILRAYDEAMDVFQ